MFVAKNKVRMHDTDMAGILYFPRQFRFIHDAWEDLMEKEGLNFNTLFNEENFVFVVVHAEADYYSPLKVGDKIEVRVGTETIGNTSFQMFYEVYTENGTLAGAGRTVHVTLDNKTRTKIPVPQSLKEKISKYLIG